MNPENKMSNQLIEEINEMKVLLESINKRCAYILRNLDEYSLTTKITDRVKEGNEDIFSAEQVKKEIDK